MIKQLPIIFEIDFENSTWGFRDERLENGNYTSNRTIQVSFMPWDRGCMMYVEVLERYSSEPDPVTTRVIFKHYYHDAEFSVFRTRLAAMEDVRGKTAENMAYDLFMGICGLDVFKEFFPKAYEANKT